MFLRKKNLTFLDFEKQYWKAAKNSDLKVADSTFTRNKSNSSTF